MQSFVDICRYFDFSQSSRLLSIYKIPIPYAYCSWNGLGYNISSHHITHDMICPNIRVVGNRFLSSCPQLARCRCGQCELTASGCLSGARCGGEEGRRSRGFPPCFRATWLQWTVETEQCCRHVSPRRRGDDGGGRRQPRARPRRGGGGRHGEAAPRRAADRGQDRRVLV